MQINGIGGLNSNRFTKQISSDYNVNSPVMANSIKMNTLGKDSVSFMGGTKELTYLAKKTIKNLPADLSGQRILMRVDHNVSFDKETGKIIDDTRIRATVDTISDLLKRKAKVIIATHVGDPLKPSKGKLKPAQSTKACAERLSELLEAKMGKVNVVHTTEIAGEKALAQSNALKNGEILYLENVRMNPAETGKNAVKNAEGLYEQVKVAKEQVNEFAKDFAKLGDIYVNDAFGAAHRKHVSTALVTEHITGPKVAGLLMEKEINNLKKLLENPKRPFVAVIGGSKISSKTETIKTLIDKVDTLVVGGGMTYTFKLAQGGKIGNSIHELDQIETAKTIIDMAKKKGVKLVLADDVVVADKFAADANTKVVSAMNIPDGWEGVDIGPKSIKKFTKALTKAKTVLWNGPVGVYEIDKFAKGTNAIAGKVAHVTSKNKAMTILGGGDTIGAIEKSGIAADKFTHVSTGGGASLEFFETNGKLPGVMTLDNLS